MTFTKLPTLRTLVSIREIYQRNSEINYASFDKKFAESQKMGSPKRLKQSQTQESVVLLIKPNYQKVLRRPICDEDLKELDDNEIMENLINFAGVLNLWRSLSFQDRFYLWEGSNPNCQFKTYHKSIIW